MTTEEWNEIPSVKPDPLYFTKYLPVEGKIKEGDSVFFNDPNKGVKDFKDWSGNATVYVIKDNHYMINLGHTTTDAELKDLKKYKLFLCSRDIQVGDKVQYLHRGELPIVREINDKDNIKEGGINYRQRFIVDAGEAGEHVVFQYMLDMNKCYKVIGEVSPDALSYVKEGQEFDEDEMSLRTTSFTQQLSVSNLYPGGEWLDKLKEVDNGSLRYSVAIYNHSCKHFH